VEREKRGGSFDLSKAFLRGGIWKNFVSRYPEANWMHKRMLALSERLARVPAAQRTRDIRRAVLRPQANDAYCQRSVSARALYLRRPCGAVCSTRRCSNSSACSTG